MENIKINQDIGLIENGHYLPSPNYNCRPFGIEPSLIVIHCISLPPKIYGGNYIDKFFTNKLLADEHPYFAEIIDLKVSAHVLIRRNGKITQYVSFNKRAWHAGNSSYKGVENCNDFSIGIELEGSDDDNFTLNQYNALGMLVMALFEVYKKLNTADIVGHSDIAPGRKTDPGMGFDWQYFNSLI